MAGIAEALGRISSVTDLPHNGESDGDSWLENSTVQKDTPLKPPGEDYTETPNRPNFDGTFSPEMLSSSSSELSEPTEATLKERYQNVLKHIDRAIDYAEMKIEGAESEEDVAAERSAKLLLENGRSILICWGCDIRIETGSLKDIQGTIFALALQSIFRNITTKFQAYEALGYPPDIEGDILQDIYSLKDFVNPIRMSQAVFSGRGPFDDMRKKIHQVAQSEAVRDGEDEPSISQPLNLPSHPRRRASLSELLPLELDPNNLQEENLNVREVPPISRHFAKYNGHPVLVEPAGESASATEGRPINGESVKPSIYTSHHRMDPLPRPTSPHRMRALLASHTGDLRWLYFNTGTILDLLGWIEKPLDHGTIMYYWVFKLYTDRFQSNDLWSLTELFEIKLDINIEARFDIAYSIVESVHRMHLDNYYHFDLRSENVLFIPLRNGEFYSLGPPILIGFDLENFGESRTSVGHAR
jgi:hypothetical protein